MLHQDSRTPFNPANVPSACFFGEIGIAEGMRVLDVGCGNGDLSRLVARIAGPGGEVVGIDRSEQALAAAANVDVGGPAAPIHYRAVDLARALPGLGRFDAIVGRRVLMYLPDAAATLDRLAALARPGAIMAFQEHARAGLPAGPGALALHRRLYDWTWSTVAAEGGDVALAFRLGTMMAAMGLSVEIARGEAILLQPGAPTFLPTLVQAMLSRIVERGVASAEEIGPETLEQRLDEERRGIDGAIVWDLAFLISARTGLA